MAATEALERAHGCLAERVDREGAISELLGAWAEVASPALAELIELLTIQVATLPRSHAEWLTVARRNSPLEVGALVGTIGLSVEGALERMHALLDRPGDPLLARLARIFSHPLRTSIAASEPVRQYYLAAFEVIERAGDPRVIHSSLREGRHDRRAAHGAGALPPRTPHARRRGDARARASPRGRGSSALRGCNRAEGAATGAVLVQRRGPPSPGLPAALSVLWGLRELRVRPQGAPSNDRSVLFHFAELRERR